MKETDVAFNYYYYISYRPKTTLFVARVIHLCKMYVYEACK